MAAAFKRAVKTESKLRMALAGPAGSGKTYTSLVLARELADGKAVAVIDTERGSASKYADIFAFDVCELESFHPDHYVEAIRAAVEAGYSVVVVDSLSHAWNGADGLLAQVERVAKLRHNGNTFKAWGDAEIRRMESALVEALTGSPIHVLATMRSKTEYVVEQNERGKATPKKIGTAPVQRDGFEYEFDIFGELTQDNELMVHKTRCPALAGAVIPTPGKQLAATLRAWLHGAKAEPVVISPVPALRAEQPATTPAAARAATDTRKPAKAAPVPAQTPTARPTAGDTFMTVTTFLSRAQAELHLNPAQAMKRLGVKSLAGINLAQSFDKLAGELVSAGEIAGDVPADEPLTFVETDGEGAELPTEPVEIDEELAAAVGRRGR